jgi:hypothetical protein
MAGHILPAAFLQLGLGLVGFELQRQQQTREQTNLRRFRAHFGVSPEVCTIVFMDIHDSIQKPTPNDFLMTLHWMTTYPKEEVLAGRFGSSEKTVRKWLWAYTNAFQALKEAKVSKIRSASRRRPTL